MRCPYLSMLWIMASTHTEDTDSSTIINFPGSSIDFTWAVKEFSGLLTFVNKTPPPRNNQLTHFLYPFFVHIYLFLLKDETFSEAERFISMYSRLFLTTEGYTEVIQELVNIKSLQEAESHSYFKNFCEHRYQIKIYEDNLKLLKEYLKGAECRILSHILHWKFSVEVIKDQNNHESTTEVSFDKEKESTSQEKEISGSNSSTRNLNVKKANSGISSRISCYHYTIYCKDDHLCCVDINHKNTLLACGYEKSGIHIWNIDQSNVNESRPLKIDTNGLKESLPTNCIEDSVSSPSLRSILKGHNGGVYGLSYASGLLMSCSDDTTVRAWSMKDFDCMYSYPAHKYPIWDVTVSSNWQYFATASLDYTACLWSFNRTTPLRIFAGHSSDVDHVRFHSNSMYVATASADKTIQLWAIQDGCSVRVFPGHDTHINSIAFSPDGKHIASADDSGHIKIWDLASGKLYSETVAHSEKAIAICFNKDSSLIASCSFDRFIKVWDVKHSSLFADKEGRKEFQAMSLVDSHSVDSLPHYVGFSQNNLLMSVGTEIRTDD